MKKYSIIAERKDQGINNLIVSRIWLQFNDMTKHGFFFDNEEEQKLFSDLLYHLMNELLKVELTVKEYFKIENDYISKIKSKEILTYTSTSIIFEDPTFELHKIFEDYLIRCIISVRKFLKVCNLLIGIEFENHKKLVNHLLSNMPKDKKNRSILEDIAKMLKEIFDYRNLIEHEELQINNFMIKQNNEEIEILIPTLKDKDVPLREYMYHTIYQIFNYYEDIITLILISMYRGFGKIVEIPEDKRNDHKNYKFHIDLNAK